MPKLGESVTEGTISTWLVKEGDHVEKYDPLAEVMTDKVNAEVPSSFAGTIKEFVADEGDTLEVGEMICYIETDSDETSAAEHEDSENHGDKKESSSQNQESDKKLDQSMRHRYSPSVNLLAQE